MPQNHTIGHPHAEVSAVFGPASLGKWARNIGRNTHSAGAERLYAIQAIAAYDNRPAERQTIAKGKTGTFFGGDLIIDVKDTFRESDDKTFSFSGFIRSPGHQEMQIRSANTKYVITYNKSKGVPSYRVRINKIDDGAVTFTVERLE